MLELKTRLHENKNKSQDENVAAVVFTAIMLLTHCRNGLYRDRIFVSRPSFFLLLLSSESAIFMTALSLRTRLFAWKQVPNARNLTRCRPKSGRLHEDGFPRR
jgi:hypothetical protein